MVVPEMRRELRQDSDREEEAEEGERPGEAERPPVEIGREGGAGGERKRGGDLAVVMLPEMPEAEGTERNRQEDAGEGNRPGKASARPSSSAAYVAEGVRMAARTSGSAVRGTWISGEGRRPERAYRRIYSGSTLRA